MNGEMLTKCRVCGAEVRFNAGVNIVNCSWCERINERPKSSPEKRINMELADELRNMGEFAEAQHRYLNVLEANYAEHRARWGLLLCKYGVMYVEDSTSGGKKRLITCRRSLPSSFRDEPFYQIVLEQAEPKMRAAYEKDAEYIDRIQAEIRCLRALDEKPYDVFLCYKETNPEGGRTEDSGIAHYIYNELTRCNYRVFYAPESLKEKAGANYEAAIFLAIETSRVMLALGTKKEYFESPWVRSEWKRYLERVDLGENKLLIPLFRNVADLPNTFQMRMLQGFEMDKPFYLEDVKTRLGKIFPSAQSSSQDQDSPEYKLAIIFLQGGKFENADKKLDDLLSAQPENPKVWLAKAMAEEQIRQEEALSQLNHDLSENFYFQQALQFASGSLKERLEGYQRQNEQKLQEAAEAARKEEEEKARKETEEKARNEAAEKARNKAEERARKEAEKSARKETEEKARWDAMANKVEIANCLLCGAEIFFKTGNNLLRCPYCNHINKRPGSSQERTDFLKLANEQKQAAQEEAKVEAAQREMEEKPRKETQEKIQKEAEENARWDAMAIKVDKANCWGCGAEIRFETGRKIIRCPYCSTPNELPGSNPEKTSSLKLANEQKQAVQDAAKVEAAQREMEEKPRKETERKVPNETGGKTNWGKLGQACETIQLKCNEELKKTNKMKRQLDRMLQKLSNVQKAEEAQKADVDQFSAMQEKTRKETEKKEQKTEKIWNIPDTMPKDQSEFLRYKEAGYEGSTNAQLQVGKCYYDGKYVGRDLFEAVKWYRKAAEQGHAQAQIKLGDCYYYGEGIEENFAEAVKWYRKAAEQGNADAQNILGYCYTKGEGVEKNVAVAVKWYRKAAEQGHAKAQNNLGVCYKNGEGVEKNVAEAVKWYRKAAEQGHIKATNTLQNIERGHCSYCGGEFNLFKKCKSCGRKKDY